MYSSIYRAISLSIALSAATFPVIATAATTFQIIGETGFTCIEGATDSCSVGENQFNVQISEVLVNGTLDSGQVAFTFSNAAGTASTMSELYFDNGTLLGISSILNHTGVTFSKGANPANLAGSNNISPSFDATAIFNSEADSPAPKNGIDPGEELMIIFNLINGNTAADTVAALTGDKNLDGKLDLRIGIHAISIGSKELSASFVNDQAFEGVPSVPLPASLVFLFSGLPVLYRISRGKYRPTVLNVA